MTRDADISHPQNLHAPLIRNALPDWLVSATPAQRQLYSHSAARRRRFELDMAKVMGQFTSPAAFAKPLLEAEIKRLYQLDIDVNDYVLVRLKNQSDLPLVEHYWPEQEPLLQAAMQNFEAREAVAGGMGKAYILKPLGLSFQTVERGSEAGTVGFALDSKQFLGISAEQFASLCRGLDLGKAYVEHFQSVFKPLPSNTATRDSAQTEVAMKLVFREQDCLENLAHIALMKKQISDAAHRMLVQAASTLGSDVKWEGQPVRYQILHLLATPLRRGTALWRAMVFEQGDGQAGCVAYLPEDTDEPLKEYPSAQALSDALREKLRDDAYREAFARYVSIDQREAFTERLLNTLNPQHGGILSDPYHQADPQADIGLRRQTVSLPFTRLRYEQQLQAIAYEARLMLVPTADQNDRQARETLAKALGGTLAVLNLASFAVPALGVLVAGLGAVQLLSEVFVGIDDWRHGQTEEALAHLMSVAENAALITATVAAGAVISRSPWVEGMVAVADQNGRDLLWDRSLAPYRSRVVLAPEIQPDSAGQYVVQGRTYVRIEGYVYEQRWDSEAQAWRIAHPDQPQAYQPLLEHNGSGAWRHVHEQPHQWDETQLLRRLGAPAEGLSDAQLTRARQASGMKVEDLQRLHACNAELPVGLADCLARMRADAQVQHFITRLAAGQPVLPGQLHAPALLVEMPRWPRELLIELAAEEPDAQPLVYGQRENLQAQRLQLTRTELAQGRLVARVLEQMSEAQRIELTGDSVEASMSARVRAVDQGLSAYAYGRRAELLKNFQRGSVGRPTREARPLLRQFPGLPQPLAQTIVASARGAEREVLLRDRVPLRLAEQAHQYQRELRLNRALIDLGSYAGVNADSQRLMLDALGRHQGWSTQVRIELREGSATGHRVAAVGDENAAIARTLVVDGDRWQALDEQGLALRTGSSLGDAVLAALPDAQRDALGYAIHEGEKLEQALVEQARADRQHASRTLGQTTALPWFRWPVRSNGGLGYELSGRGWPAWLRLGRHSVNSRLRRLYPSLSDDHLRTLRAGLVGDLDTLLTRLETEYRVLERSLDAWAVEPVDRDPSRTPWRTATRQEIARRIKAAWRREGIAASGPGHLAAIELNLTGLYAGPLPKLVADLHHVYELKLGRMALTDADLSDFLPAFDGAVAIDLGENRLTGVPSAFADMRKLREVALDHNRLQWQDGLLAPLEQLPLRELDLGNNVLPLSGAGIQSIARLKYLRKLIIQSAELTLDAADFTEMAKLKQLRVLDLSRNQISLTPESAAALGQITSLQMLRLNHNPLGRSPQLANLTRLEHLEMTHAQLSEWPSGLPQLMARQAGSLRSLSLLANPIVHVPAMIDTAFGQAVRRGAQRNLLVSGQGLSAQSRRHVLELFFEPVEDLSDAEWMRGAGTELNHRLKQLQEDPGSANFLLALERSTLTADYRSNPQRQRHVMWQLLVDLTPDPAQPGMDDLRAQLYQAADDAEGTCGDGLQLVFNHARNMVQVYKVLLSADASEPATVMPAVVYGKRLFRLDLVDDHAMRIARLRSARRAIIYPDWAEVEVEPTLTTDPALLESPAAALDPLDSLTDAELQDAPDEAEIRLKLRLMLVDTLDLPNVAKEMLYVAHVEEHTAREVGIEVKRQTTTEGLLGWLVQQPWWSFLLARTWPAQLEVFEERWNQGYTALFELSRPAPEAVSVPAEILKVFKDQLPDKAWDSTDLSTAVQLDELESAILTGALDAARDKARTVLYRDLSRSYVLALRLEDSEPQ